jgi:acyl transferase domain-containing protein/thioesterase domain-containing protein/aryl carrier-like protein
MIKMKENRSKPWQTGLEIAVIGMSGRFPGANDIHAFWENIKNGVETITFFSEEELQEPGITPEILNNPGYVKTKGYIEDLQYFDSAFFNYTPNEAASMDPQLRLFHEGAWHALEDAGYDPWTYPGLIGLYAGYTPNILWKVGRLAQGDKSSTEIFELMNLNSDFFSSLICYKLNLRGPGVTVNTACSTSLTAIHLASRALLSGEAGIALAGGVTVTLPWKCGYVYQEGMVLSPDGHCRPFDAGAKGTGSGNGCGAVVLKRLVKAITDNDHIYAVIKGTAINNDGNLKAGYTAVSVEGQARVIRAAQRLAEVDPGSITYIETHGIGTPLGDSIEIEALKKAFSQTHKKRYCRLGFLKANTGHLDAAAGVAGFIKTVLALFHRFIPPAVNFTTLNPAIDLENSPFYIDRNPGPWHPDENPLRAGVSSFGIGGTNAHVILEEPPEGTRGLAPLTTEPPPRQHHLILLSAKTETALDKMTRNLLDYFKNSPANPVNHENHGPDQGMLADAAYTLQVGRSAFSNRRLLVCSTINQVLEGLSALCDRADTPDHPGTGTAKENLPIIFRFPGIGGQYVNMGRELYRSVPLFRQETDRCFKFLESLTGDGIEPSSLPGASAAIKINPGEMPRLEMGIFIVEYALGRLLLKAGIKPRALVGDNLGEYAAACLAGVFSPGDAIKLLIAREQPPQENGETLTVFEKQVSRLTLNKPAIPIISNVTGKPVTPGDAVNPRYWAVHLGPARQCTGGLQESMITGDAVCLEVGPGGTLSTQARQYMDGQQEPGVIGLVRPPDREISDMEYLLTQLGRLWLSGAGIDWGVFYDGEKRKRVSLPGYPFDRLVYGIEMPLVELGVRVQGHGGKGAPAAAAAALTPNRPALATPYAAPRGRVEEILVQMWEDLLGIRPIGIHDDLMEMGANSLKAITFINRFKEQWGAIIHAAAFFAAPTVSGLAAYFGSHYPDHFARMSRTAPGEKKTGEKTGQEKLNNERENQIAAAVTENLLLLNRTSPKAEPGNIFFIHEISGEVGAYMEFCRLLDTGLNCWGVQAPRLKNYKPQNRTIEEIAGIYLEKIKRIQPGGPYYLATWSGGGHIVFEMALQMEQQEEVPGLLVFFDCRGPMARINNKPTEFTLETEKNFLKGFFGGTGIEEKLERITEIHHIWPVVVEILESDPSYKEGLEKFIRQDPLLSLLNFEGQRVKEIVQYLNLSRTFQKAADRYLPARKLQTPLHFFEGTEASQAIPVYWQEYCAQPIIHHKMRGDHYSIFKPPLVKEFAGIFSELLKNKEI